MKIAFLRKRFGSESSALISHANVIIDEYTAQGYRLTLRQLYYQFVSRDLLPNNVRSYKRLGNIVADARLAGLIDWDAIEDRARNVVVPRSWDSPHEILGAAARSYRIDVRDTQSTYLEVWVEKEALIGIVEMACEPHRVPYIGCKGYMSLSEMFEAGFRRIAAKRTPRNVVVHLGDHDPSGIDMTRDISDRLNLFAKPQGFTIDVERIALNMDQVEQYSPPPNPAKLTDSRCAGYMEKFGDESWELDALEPSVLVDLISRTIDAHTDADELARRTDEETEEREALAQFVARYGDDV